ncbi:MAG TPA: sulfite oxidase-like oxidoreductase [Planctomycetota bacterium]|nr:sulfite oxidase-like oxidoreductase [Planctomycetota bacterium]
MPDQDQPEQNRQHPDPAKQQKLVEGRQRIMARWKQKMETTPARTDDKPQGSGPLNRHGMPQLPAGQHETKGWPVLDLGFQPDIPLERWTLTIDGEVEHPLVLKWADFLALPQTSDVSDFHCVTSWSKMDVPWVGVRVADLAALAQVKDTATHLLCHGYDGYTTNVPLEEALKPDVLCVHTAEGQPLAKEHGGPVRMITPQLYAWKGSKWIKRLQFLTQDNPGFWEVRGYSNSAHPWREDRYS